MPNYKIAVVNSSSFGRYFTDLMIRLKKSGTVQRFEVSPEISGKKLAAKLSGFDFIIASVTPKFSREFFENVGEQLKLISRHGIGCDNVAKDAATANGVIVTRVEGIHERDAVAELAVSLLMSCIRDIAPAAKAVGDGRWADRQNFIGIEVSKKTVGIIGYGNIGSRTAEILKEGFHCEVLAHDPNIAAAVIAKNGIKPVSFTEILEKSDILSLHASLNEDNYQFIGQKEFDLMKKGVIIINTARGELINETDLACAVKEGKVKAAGLDVVQREPIKETNPLFDLEGVLIVPHIGGYTEYSLRAMDEKMVEDVENYIAGRKLEQVINPEVINYESDYGC